MKRYGRERGKKFMTWQATAHGRRVLVEIRLVDRGTKFWVDMPEHGIDLEGTDLAVLKKQVQAALEKQAPITWKDVLRIEITYDEDDFPCVEFSTMQLGVDAKGTQYSRSGPHHVAERNWPRSGKSDQSFGGSECVVLIVEATSENKRAVTLMKQALTDSFRDLLKLFGVKPSGKDYNFKATVNEEALAKRLATIARDGFMVDFGEQK